MAKKKNFIAPKAIAIRATSEQPDVDKAVVEVGEGVMHHGRFVDLEKWLGKGIDEWVWLGIYQLRAFLVGKTKSVESIVTYGRQGWPVFLKFILSTNPNIHPNSISSSHILKMIAWIRNQSAWNTKTRSTHYSSIKTILCGMIDRGSISLAKCDFPINPFANDGSIKETGSQAHAHLSNTERARVAGAIKLDLIAIHKKKFEGNDVDELTVYILGIAIRTGINTTPLLELERDALGPHPFIPNQRLLKTKKRRNGTIQQNSIRETKLHEGATTFPMDGIALFEMAIQKTRHLSKIASHPERNRLWIHRSPQKDEGRSVKTLNVKDLSNGIKNLINRHNLRGDDGMRLQLNLSRIRKTVENRYWALSGGDIFSVAQLMGHTRSISDRHYLQLTNEMRNNATIVAKDIPIIYKNNNKSDCNELEQTPVGQCQDSLFGEKAPKDGNNHCMDFMSCFNCRSYAITGSSEDLHRLFSFYWFLEDEVKRTSSKDWREYYLSLRIRIDEFARKNFNVNDIERHKEESRIHRHPFWNIYRELNR